jgi:hypothetical protein
MTRPTFVTCQDRLTQLVAEDQPEDYLFDEQPIRVGNAKLTSFLVHYTTRGGAPREARLVFGGDQRLLFAFVIDPGMCGHALEEGFDAQKADELATLRVDGLDAVVGYLKGLDTRG